MSSQNNTNSHQTPPSGGQTPPFSVDSLQKNPKFIITIKTFVTYGTILYAVNVIVGLLLSAFSFNRYYSVFNVPAILFAIIFGAIAMVVVAVVFYFIYEPVKNWVKHTPFLAKYIRSMFTFFWKPYLVIFIITAILGLLGILNAGAAAVGAMGPYGYSAAGFGGLFIGWIIIMAVHFALFYWFAKNVSAKLEHFYPW